MVNRARVNVEAIVRHAARAKEIRDVRLDPSLSEMGGSVTSVSLLAGAAGFAVVGEKQSGIVPPMERTEAELIAAAVKGDTASFEPLIQKYSPRVFATARRYARLEREVEDIVQESCDAVFEAKVPVGLGPLHTVFDDPTNSAFFSG